jgi:hypothetical protein
MTSKSTDPRFIRLEIFEGTAFIDARTISSVRPNPDADTRDWWPSIVTQVEGTSMPQYRTSATAKDVMEAIRRALSEGARAEEVQP